MTINISYIGYDDDKFYYLMKYFKRILTKNKI